MKTGGILFGVLFVVVLLLGSPNAEAQKKKEAPKKVIKMKEIVIKQRVIKPQAMFILSKSQHANVKSDITTSQTFSEGTLKTLDGDFLK